MTEEQELNQAKAQAAAVHAKKERALRDHRNLMAALSTAERSIKEARRLATRGR